MTELNDELLVAYADGQLAQDQLRAVERVLSHDPFAAERVAMLRQAHIRFEGAFRSMLRGGGDPECEDERPAEDEDAEMDEGPPSAAAPVRIATASSLLHRAVSLPREIIAGTRSSAAEALILVRGFVRGSGRRGVTTAAAGWERIARVFQPVGLSPARRERTVPSWNARLIEAAAAASRMLLAAPLSARLAGSIAGVVIIGSLIVVTLDGVAPIAAVDQMTTASIPHGDWREEAARAQALLSRESLEIGLESQGNLDLVAFQLSKAFGADIVIPNLEAHGLTFKRAQLLRHEGKPLAQIAYLANGGGPLVLYLSAEKGETLPEFRKSGTLSTVSWTEGGLTYLIVGDGGRERMVELLDAVRGSRLGMTQ